jgi:hypothetical protein
MKALALLVRKAARGGKISCERLLRLARETNAAPAELGKICDEEGIKIRRCQLGCFD